MQLGRFVSGAVDFLRRLFKRFFSSADTARFLNERNARITAQEIGSKSFYTVKLYPETDVHVKGETLRIQVRLLSLRRIRVSVYNTTKQQSLANVTVPYDEDGGTMNLNLDDIYLKLEIDPDPTYHSS